MSGDYSRVRFDPGADFAGVQMQQGRVQLDSDCNESVALHDRRLRAESVDTFGIHPKPGITGVAVVSPQTPDAFKIDATGGDITIGRGRMYVDGLLAENHGGGAREFDPVLAELRGVNGLDYNEQPYFPDAPSLPANGRRLAYLEVWQREVTHLQYPNLVENAVGVDTTTRLQTVWQVRLLEDIGGANCSTPEDQFPTWKALIQPSEGRMSIRAEGVPPDLDPCQLAPGGGYRGLENQLYRIEIHDGGTAGAATFKWSRDNASVASNVVEIVSDTELKLASLGRDAVLRFNSGDWVEVLDDRRELSGESSDAALRRGVIRKITVDEASQSISFSDPLPADLIPDPNDNADTPGSRHTRVKRWDQKGTIRDSDDNVVANLDSAGSSGLITVPAAGTWVVLEKGVQVQFSLNSVGGNFHCGDYWVSAARTADASVEELTGAPPRGIHRHYARLAIVTFPDVETDCRIIWPPSSGGCCTYTVGDGVRSHGDFHSIQQAINRLPDAGGRICVLPGEYHENLLIIHDNITIHGCGKDSVIVAETNNPAIHIVGAVDIGISELTIKAHADGEGVRVDATPERTPARISLNHLNILATAQSAIAIMAGQFITIRDNHVLMQGLSLISAVLVTADDVLIEHNSVMAIQGQDHTVAAGVQIGLGLGGLQIGGTSERVRVIDNLIQGGAGNGITLGSIQTVSANSTVGSISMESLSMLDSAIIGSANVQSAGALYDIRIERNRIFDMGMNGIGVADFFDLANHDEFITVVGLDILGNTIRNCLQRSLAVPEELLLDMAYGGISLADVEMLRLHDNRIEDNGPDHLQAVCGVFVLHGEGLDISHNHILNNGAKNSESSKDANKGLRGGIVVRYAIAGIASLEINDYLLPRQNGIPAARIHDNTVSQPLGQALLLGALGPVSIQGNSLTSRGIVPGFSLGLFASTVMILNLGRSNELYGQIIAFAGARSDIWQQESVAVNGDIITTSKAGLDDQGIGHYLANGNVMFNDNQVVGDLMELEVSATMSSVLIISLDDISFADNQLDASFLIDLMLSNAIVLGMSVRINDNRFKESLILALYSVISLGLLFNHTVDNQATHCIFAKGLLKDRVRDNHILMVNQCERLNALGNRLDKHLVTQNQSMAMNTADWG